PARSTDDRARPRRARVGASLSSHRQLALGLEEHLVHIAPRPVLPRLERLDDRVLAPVEVFRGVLVLRGITAADMAAGEAEPEVDPGVPHLQALLATLRGVRAHVFDLVEMRANGHRSLLS